MSEIQGELTKFKGADSTSRADLLAYLQYILQPIIEAISGGGGGGGGGGDASASNQVIANNLLLQIKDGLVDGDGKTVDAVQNISAYLPLLATQSGLDGIVSLLQGVADGALKNSTGTTISAVQAIQALLAGSANGVLKNGTGDAITALQSMLTTMNSRSTAVLNDEALLLNMLRTKNYRGGTLISGTLAPLSNLDVDTTGYASMQIIMRNEGLLSALVAFQSRNKATGVFAQSYGLMTSSTGAYQQSITINAGVQVAYDRSVMPRFIRFQNQSAVQGIDYEVYLRT